MKASELTKSITALVEQKVPTFLWGAPGVGKSSIMKQIAKEKAVDKIWSLEGYLLKEKIYQGEEV